MKPVHHAILVSVLTLRDGAYGLAIARNAGKLLGKNISAGSVYMTLERFGDSGMVVSWIAEVASEKGNKHPRRFFRLTPAGMQTLKKEGGPPGSVPLFFEAQDYDPVQLPAFYERNCGDDTALREEVAALLEYYGSATDWPAPPRAEPVKVNHFNQRELWIVFGIILICIALLLTSLIERR